MDRQEILKRVSHTLLAQTATWQKIKKTCDGAVTYNTVSVYIPPFYVKQAAEYLGKRMSVCTIIGFPNGYDTTGMKCLEMTGVMAGGTKEIDMVVSLGWVKEGRYDLVKDEIQQTKKAYGGWFLKVITETCLSTEAERKELCRVVTESDAEYIEISTGFPMGDATFEDMEPIRKYTGADRMVEVAGGIKDLAGAERFMKLGADRLGTSRLVKIIKE